jgi:hypothetical protein
MDAPLLTPRAACEALRADAEGLRAAVGAGLVIEYRLNAYTSRYELVDPAEARPLPARPVEVEQPRVRWFDLFDDVLAESYHASGRTLDVDAPLVYVMQRGSDGPYKIGRAKGAKRVRDRLSTLQTGSAERITLRRVFQGDAALEAALHKKFARARLEGEWFRPARGLRLLVETYGLTHLPAVSDATRNATSIPTASASACVISHTEGETC